MIKLLIFIIFTGMSNGSDGLLEKSDELDEVTNYANW